MIQTDKYAVVTGAGKGIGRAIAKLLAENNYRVIACSRTLSDLQSLQSETTNVHPFVADLSTLEGVGALIAFVANKCTVPHVIINNAGLYIPDTLLDTKAGILNQMMQVNYWAGYRLTMPFLKPMVERAEGHIVNICSLSSIEPKTYGSSYSITKHAQLGFSRNIANDLRSTGIKVTAILPGNVDTPSWDGFEGDRSNFFTAEAVAQVVLQEIESGQSREVVMRNKE